MFDIFYIGNKPTVNLVTMQVSSIEEALVLCRTKFCWILHYLCDYSGFDLLWEPKPWEAHYQHAFKSQWQQDSGTYLIPKKGASEIYYNEICINRFEDKTNWEIPDGIDITGFDFSWHPDLLDDPFIYQFGTQWQKTGGPKYTVPAAITTKYVRDQVVTVHPSMENWEIPDGIDIDGFDFSWHPDGSEPPYIYQFGTQWQKTGGPKYTVPDAKTTKYTSQVVVENINVATEVYLIDHGNPETENVIGQLESKGLTIKKKARFISSYHGTLKRILSLETNEFVWVCSSVCDYSDFDFSWHPEKWQGTMFHVFPSNEQKFGDTFLINTSSFNTRIRSTEILEWYDTLNFVSDIPVKRWGIETVNVRDDSIVDNVLAHTFTSPLVLFSNKDVEDIPTVNLWREKTRTVVPLSNGANSTVVPRDAKNHIIAQLYDYPFIDKTHRKDNIDDPLDILFISNGESNADEHWDHLLTVTKNAPNRVIRIDGVKGRAEAYQTASTASNTAWAFNVFAKLKVNPEFDWSWQPDRMQESKHYIFNAKNPITGLEYGHMGMIAYNKKLVLKNKAEGLDFTLDQEHEVVPLLSGIAYYANDIGTAWRSAFREVLKLKDDDSGNVETEYRLSKWLSSNNTELGIWSQRGAEDAVEYYEAVDGNFEKLKLSYEWDWLNDYFNEKYGEEHVL